MQDHRFPQRLFADGQILVDSPHSHDAMIYKRYIVHVALGKERLVL